MKNIDGIKLAYFYKNIKMILLFQVLGARFLLLL
jgi:hypothetical protein